MALSPLSTAIACIKIYFLTISLASSDVAEIDVLGFSSTGEAVYLQQGRQNGSGFPYAIVSSVSGDNLVEIDSVLLKNSSASVGDARSELSLEGVERNLEPASLLLKRTHSDLGSFERTVRFHASDHYDKSDTPLQVQLTPYIKEPSVECYGLYEHQIRFTLAITDTEPNSLPAKFEIEPSGCVQAVRFGSIFLHQASDDKKTILILLMVDLPGFEGTKVRWIGITYAF